MTSILEQLQSIVSDRVRENELMSKHTNFRIGGPAMFFVEIKSVDELRQVLEIAKTNGLKMVIMGGGSNMLVSDNGFDGILIKMAMREIRIVKNIVQADAGVLMSMLARKTADAWLTGIEWAVSLPGTVGGAVRGNAGCFGGETKDRLVSADVLRFTVEEGARGNGQGVRVEFEIITLLKSELGFGYRESVIKYTNDIVLSATFELEPGDQEKSLDFMKVYLEKRKLHQPIDAGSAGCMFKNYDIESDAELERLKTKLDLPLEISHSRRISAGWLIDQLDLKGKQIGGAKVSEKHGNFLVNTGHATADNVVQLIALIKTRARDEYGISLHEEVQYVGF